MVVFNQQEAMRPIQIRMFQGLCSKTPMFNPMKQGDTLVPERILKNGADDGDDADENGDDDAEDQMTIMMMMISAG